MPAFLPSEGGVDQVLDRGSGQQAVERPFVGGVCDHEDVAAVPVSRQIVQEVVGGFEDLTVALPAGKGIVDVLGTFGGQDSESPSLLGELAGQPAGRDALLVVIGERMGLVDDLDCHADSVPKIVAWAAGSRGRPPRMLLTFNRPGIATARRILVRPPGHRRALEIGRRRSAAV
ncbi:hypothetical protein AB0B45_11460 [Nonomuraea sp. NPDC049152]|uniref:hypothetical protein n=1 Tax=Nonomuraea sp. NPDC049152 TaxID=3154350 RepID=UPI00340C29B5